MASIDVAGDVQLLEDLRQAWTCNQPHRASNGAAQPETVKNPPLPPRIRMVVDVGHAMILLADRVSEHKTTLSLASDGMYFSCFTGFSDVVARRRDKAVSRSVFRREEELQQRRKEAADDADFALPTSMLKPQLRRHFSQPPAKLQDDYSISMRLDGALTLEPMSLHLTLDGEKSRDQRTYHLASIGRLHSTITGDILGRHDVHANCNETASLDMTSVSCALDMGIDSGIKMNLWETAVINALVAMGHAHRQNDTHTFRQADQQNLLNRLPSGVSARMSLGLVSVFIGHQDPNPNCDLKLVRGLWLQSTFTCEYAYYKHPSQAMKSRHALLAPPRAKLQLPEDITTQALAFFNHLSPRGGRAALVSFVFMDTIVMPIFNGQRFVERGGTHMSHARGPIPRATADDEFVGWEFRRPKPKDDLKAGKFPNSVPPLEISDTDQAQRPLIRVPNVTFNWLAQRAEPELASEHKLTSRVASVLVVADLSHIYTTLLALLAVREVARAWKKPKQVTESPQTINISAEVILPSVTAHLAFPLKEHLLLYVGGVTVSRPPDGRVLVGNEQLLAYVPSARVSGSWEELGKIKRLDVHLSHPLAARAIAIGAEALRLRIPVGYHLSKLILNINVTLKAIKLLSGDLGGPVFAYIRKPGPEEPKNLPRVDINVQYMCLEAKDNPIETNLNLIWRAGLVEQETRNALEDAFERKLNIIGERTDAEVSLDAEHEHSNGRPHSSRLTEKYAVSLDEARYRLDWWKSRCWVRRIRAAKQEQRRRETAALKHMQNIGPDIRVPINITPATQTPPLFRAAMDGVKISVCNPGLPRSEIIKYMGDVSQPFDDDVQFSLIVPLKLSWSMAQGVVKLRDYPLPLIRIQNVVAGDRPAFHLETPFIIAEELRGDDSFILIPCEVVPEGCGDTHSAPFTLQIAKTIMPVKTYARPVIEITSHKTTEFTWGNSYQPAIHDLTKVVESLSHPPRDPSPKVGFWDKFRLVLHWRVTMNFVGAAHLHLKGESGSTSGADTQVLSIHTV